MIFAENTKGDGSVLYLFLKNSSLGVVPGWKKAQIPEKIQNRTASFCIRLKISVKP
jgi:hypothetical protein